MQGHLVAVRDYNASGIATLMRYQDTDAQGSIIRQTDSSGNQYPYAGAGPVYDAWGRQIGGLAQDGPGYTGHVMDLSTNLIYMQQRYYDPSVGRFLSMDPVDASNADGSNLDRYWYAQDDPYRYTDPNGLFVCAKGTDCSTVTKEMNSAINTIQKAAATLSSSVVFTNQIAGRQLTQLAGFLKSDNAVVAIGQSSGGEPGSSQAAGSHQPVNMTMDFAGARSQIQNSRYHSDTNVEMAAVIAHEAQHAYDIYNGRAPTNQFESYRMSEYRAYDSQAAVDRGTGTNSSYGLWSPSWPASYAAKETPNQVDQWAQYSAKDDCLANGCQP